jgi:hypothetical protein
MTRAILVALCLGTFALSGVALGARLTFEERAAVQESLSRVHPRMRASWLRARGLDDSYYTTFRRPESSGLECIGRWPWGPSWELAGRDTFLYLGSGSGVRILSIADSVHPRMLGQINARGLVSQVVVQDSLLFVACGSWGAQIYSVSDPANPRDLGSMDAVIGDLCVQDTFCYTAGEDSFRIYNFASPDQPTQVGVVGDGGDVIVGANGYVYVGHGSSGSGLNVYDVHDPADPMLVNTLGGVQLAMFTRGHWLFRISEQPAYFSMMDISEPDSPSEVGRITGYGGVAMYADDKYAYLSGSYEHSGLFVVDISDSSHPQLRDSINPEGLTELEPYVPRRNSYGYLADHYGGLVTLDLHDANSISQVWAGYQAHEAVDIVVDGERAFVANQCAGLQILDVADPRKPTSLGRYDTLGSKQTRTATARDSFAFSGMSGITGRRFLRVLDILEPSNPTLVAQESCYNPPEDYVLRDSLLYAAEANQFQVFNVARPREPVLVGSCASTDGNLFGLAVQDSLAFEASLYGMWVINVARPDSPFVVSSNLGRNAAGIAARDTLVYLPAAYDTLWVYSVASPSSPRVLGFAPLLTHSADVALGETTAAVATAQGLELFSLSDPAHPRRIASTTAPYALRRVVYAQPYYYAAMWEAGVAIYETMSVGIYDQSSEKENPRRLRVWPSVTGNDVRFTVGPTVRSPCIAIYDILGKRLRDVRLKCEQKGGATKGVIDLAGLATGVYVVRVKSEGTNLTAKVVKTNRR